MLSPAPPLSATAATGNRKPPGIRARRLRLSQTNLEHLPDFSRVERSPGTGTTAGDTDLTLQRFQQLTRTNVPLLPLPARIPRPPLTSALGEGLLDSWYGIIKGYFYIPMCMYLYSIKTIDFTVFTVLLFKAPVSLISLS